MIIQRDLFKKIEPNLNSPEAIVITGMRRIGKTTLLEYIYDKIESKNKLLLDLENPLNQKYFEQSDFEQIKDNLETLGVNFANRPYIFLDEIQLVDNLPQIVKYLKDHYQVKFFLTGSASFYLKNNFSESLAGRKYIYQLNPFNFREFLRLKEVNLNLPDKHDKITESVFQNINKYYQEYVEFGGFPQVIKKDSHKEKQKTLEDIFTSYFQFEVEQLSDFRKVDKLRDLILLLLERVGSRINKNKLSQELGVARSTVSEYISFLEGTYFLHLIQPYSQSKDVEIRKSPKIYTIDSGLTNYISEVNRGAVFEQNIFQLLNNQYKLNYYQKKSGAEIDFILNEEKSLEVKLTAREKHLNKLKKLSKSLEIEDYNIAALNYSELEKVIYGFEI